MATFRFRAHRQHATKKKIVPTVLAIAIARAEPSLSKKDCEVGLADGRGVGLADGIALGLVVGTALGSLDGLVDGFELGEVDGELLGILDGEELGDTLG